ncbi:lysylphosphatidylglycerol synthase domain-containing protein [Gilvimarinus sp. DA14]|uniref:lysylphosphatidylglycerol synthase domain-containing protein n=1 Tax=Gilvimarinus sp. DA14 TaxID=2956798 RepID=UPI0020B73BD1|nr:lysylphosphatidylglycerol synthase domain-containing protein [Gilvimarinus sp. DA14]UTF58981.1 lysylphosphatidylglycerol synthase domain-containing protein [Gilvimarinus sp. DA14]
MSATEGLKNTWTNGYDWAREKLPWPIIKKVLTVVFFVLVATLLVKQGATIEWAKVWQTLKDTSVLTLGIGAGLGFLCYCVYASYDLLGRYLLKLKVSWPKTWFAAGLCYAFNLNLSALVGGVAFRYRLYSRLGIKAADVTRILGISVVTNWSGYILLAGGLFVSGQINPPDSWPVGQISLQVIGAVFILVIAAYVGVCWGARKREYRFKSTTITLPPVSIALLQLVMACAHWTLMASVIYQFMPDEIAFATVFAVLLVSALAGVITHIPGGLGVLEAVFIALLSGQVDKTDILAGLFAYRCVFYLLPLAVATPLYLIFEASTRKREKVSA